MNKLMKILRGKMKDKKGFTLMEMLIVVAIIAILVAIAVPTFNSSLETARKAADDANMRTAKIVASAMITNHQYDSTQPEPKINDYFDATDGTFKTGKVDGYGKSKDNSGEAIKVTGVDADTGEVTLEWAAPSAS